MIWAQSPSWLNADHQIGRAHGLNSSHLVISYAVFCLKKKTRKSGFGSRAANRTTRPPAAPQAPHVRAARSPVPALRCKRCWKGWTSRYLFFFFNDTATTEIYTLSLHDALPI